MSQNDVLEGIKDKAQTMWQSASRSRTLKRQDVSPHQICTGTLFQVGQMLGLDQQVLGKGVYRQQGHSPTSGS